jgi:regulator of replication initiation timing
MTRYKNSILKQLQDLTVDALKIAIENLKRERNEAVKEAERLKEENTVLRATIATLCGAEKQIERK